MPLIVHRNQGEEHNGNLFCPLVVGGCPGLDLVEGQEPSVAAVAKSPRPITSIDSDQLGLL
jgi:hypothetical protein